MLPDVKLIRSIVKENSDALFILDGAQLVPHRKVDVQELGIDFIIFSGHKLLGPTGIGVVWGRLDLLNELPPYQGGGEMIASVTFEKTTYADLPHKFEAGTPNISGGIAFGAALDYMNKIGFEAIASYEKELLIYATDALKKIDGLRIYGEASEKTAVISFNVGTIHPYDIGHHCVQPFHRKLGIDATFRATGYIYNDKNDLDVFKDATAPQYIESWDNMAINEKVQEYKKILDLFPNAQEKYQYLIEHSFFNTNFPEELSNELDALKSANKSDELQKKR